jgi:long-chain fatty acid transport protein
MSRLEGKQIALALHGIKPSAKFSDSGSVGAAAQNSGGNGGDAGSLALVPNVYFAMQVNPMMRMGLGINAPFGLQTEYESNWLGRFQAIKSKIETVNLNPSMSYQINDAVSIGAGVNYQQIKGDLTSAVNYSAVAGSAAANLATPGALVAGLTTIATSKVEGVSTISGSDSAWGYNFGILYKVNPQTRIGIAYRSKITYNLSGTVSFTPIPSPLSLLGIPLLQNGSVTLPITMPSTFSVSGFHQLSDKFDLMSDFTWTGWSVLQQLKIDRTSGLNVQTVQENWKNTWRIAAGANYHYSEQWTSRIGVAYDQSPVSNDYRTARIPDNDRTWLSVGGQYKVNKSSALDFGYSHLFVQNASISDKQAAAGKGNLIGTYSNSVDILSVQYTHSF